jgi:hypothetical protein
LGKTSRITLSEAAQYSEIPEIAQVDELETFIAKKKQNMAADSGQSESSWHSSLDSRRPQRRNF